MPGIDKHLLYFKYYHISKVAYMNERVSNGVVDKANRCQQDAQ